MTVWRCSLKTATFTHHESLQTFCPVLASQCTPNTTETTTMITMLFTGLASNNWLAQSPTKVRLLWIWITNFPWDSAGLDRGQLLHHQKQETGEERGGSSEKEEERTWPGQFHSPQFFDQPSEISVKCRIVMKMLQWIIFYRYKLYTPSTQYVYYIKIF